MKNLKKGISLITLVITIILVIIIVRVVVLNLANNNPIESASKAKIASDIDTFKSELTLYINSKYTKDKTFGEQELNGLSGDALEAVLPSMKGQIVGNKNYSEVLTISNGQLVMQDTGSLPSDFDIKTKETLEEIFSGAKGVADPSAVPPTSVSKYTITYNAQGGENEPIDNNEYETNSSVVVANGTPTKSGSNFICWNTKQNGSGINYSAGDIVTISNNIVLYAIWETEITAEMVKADATVNVDGTHNKYIGKTVTYSGYDEEKVNQSITWRIYGVDKDNKILLIANDYVNLDYKKEDAESAGITISGYNIYVVDSRETLINYLKTSSNWSEYAIAGKTTAYGTPTVKQFLDSYKLRHPEKYLIGNYYENQTEATNAGKSAVGWDFRFSSGTSDDMTNAYFKKIGTTDSFYIKLAVNYGSAETHAYWLASPSASVYIHMLDVTFYGNISYYSYGYKHVGIRPVISLNDDTQLIEKNGIYTVK